MSKLTLIFLILVGFLAGVGGVTFRYAEGLSYFSADPRACMNCHIMRGQFDSWQKSSHHSAATCVECHLPASFIPKWIAKAENGYHHSLGFTLQNFHEPIQIKSKNSRILQDNCVRCHADFLHGVLSSEMKCVHCHSTVGHRGPNL